MPIPETFEAHLASGLTTVARCWLVLRKDGQGFGFTDHDRDLSFDGHWFRADTGLTAQALQQTTGLAIDNSEALGALSDAAVTEADIAAGRFDGAEVRAWLVNWTNPEDRLMQFRGHLGEVTRIAGGFRAELLGLSEALNRPQGFVYQTPCSAVLGDGRCRFDTSAPGYADTRAVEQVEDGTLFRFSGFAGYEDRWFERGRFEMLTGEAAGLVGVVKNDRLGADTREVELWQAIRAPIEPGDMVRIVAGCDKRADTCRLKFNNFLNFRGFPDMPGEDWLWSVPTAGTVNDGASLDAQAILDLQAPV